MDLLRERADTLCTYNSIPLQGDIIDVPIVQNTDSNDDISCKKWHQQTSQRGAQCFMDYSSPSCADTRPLTINYSPMHYNKLFQFLPVPFQRKPLEGLQVQSPETSMRKRGAPVKTQTLNQCTLRHAHKL